MNTIAEMFETAVQQHQAGQLPQAVQLYQQILQRQPNHAGALNLMGVIACQSGKLAEGITFYQKAIAVQPKLTEAHHNLALALQLVGRTDEAISHYQSTLALQPKNAQADHNLGSLLVQRGKIAEAVQHYQRAIVHQPDYAQAYVSLGLLLAQQGRVEDGIIHLQRAIQWEPNNAKTYHQLGQLLNLQGCMDEALPYLEQSLSLQVHPQTHYSIGKTLEEQGRLEEAQPHFQATLKLLPDCAEAYWHQQLSLPILYDRPEQIAPARQRFCRGLNQLIHSVNLHTPEGRRYALNGLGSRTNFYLAYQGLNDRGLQCKYGRFIHQVMAANFPQWVQPLAKPSRKSENQPAPVSSSSPSTTKIRVGYLSAHLMAHSAAAWARGWIRARDRQNFEVYCYHIGQRVDFVTQEFRDLSDQFRHIPGQLEAIAQQVLADQLDVLILTDIGMDPQTSLLAGLRLAPVQCTAWGHPVTSGIPTIDYYLSSELMEPPNAQQHYSERLLRLPNIGICYPKPPRPPVRRSRADYNLREDATIYLSFQSPYKYLPQYDRVFAQIAQRVPKAQFVFMCHNSNFIVERFQQRLQRVFAEVGLKSEDYCVFLPKLDRESFWSLNLVSDVALDAFDWSGGNSTLEAVAYGLPVVTCPGKFMRGRHSYAILQRLEVSETIAADQSAYVEIATQLGLRPEWRQTIATKIRAGHDRLYDDQACVTALEAFFKQVAG